MESFTLIFSWRLPDSPCGSGVTIKNYLNNVDKKKSYKIVGEPVKDFNLHNSIRIRDYSKIFRKGRRFFRALLFPLKLLSIFITLSKIDFSKVKKIAIVYPNYEYLIFGFFTAIIYKKPFDIWFHNTYADNTFGILNTFSTYIEKLIVDKCRKFYVLTEALKDHYSKKYPNKDNYILRHGFDAPLNEKSNSYDIANKDSLIFGITGTINESNFDATFTIVEYLLELYECKIKIFGNNNDIISEFEKFDKKQVIFTGFLEDEKFYEESKKIDILLLCHGFEGKLSNIEYQTIFPTRLVPYLNLDKPILLFSKKGFYINNFFHDNDIGWVVDVKDKRVLKNTIDGIFSSKDKFHEKLDKAKKAYKLFSVKSNANIFDDFISEI